MSRDINNAVIGKEEILTKGRKIWRLIILVTDSVFSLQLPEKDGKVLTITHTCAVYMLPFHPFYKKIRASGGK